MSNTTWVHAYRKKLSLMRQNLKKSAFLEKSKCLTPAQSVVDTNAIEGVNAMANKNERDKECSYEQMSNEGKEGGQSITKVDNSIHSEYWNEPMINNYETTRKSFMGDKGFDWSGMEKGKR